MNIRGLLKRKKKAKRESPRKGNPKRKMPKGKAKRKLGLRERLSIPITMKSFRVFSWFLPGRYKRNTKQLLIYAGKEWDSDKFLGVINFVSLFILLIGLQYSIMAGNLLIMTLSFLSFLLIHAITHFYIYFKMLSRTKKIEQYLPDALQLIAANVRAGMTPFQALRFAARDEFGDLKTEIERATAKAFGTTSFSQALLSIKERINSRVLERAIQLFVSSMKSGAHMANILEEAGRDISENRSLKNELATNTKMYSMFILFIVMMGTPFLLVISIRFLEMITALQVRSSGQVGFGMSFLMSEVTITPEFLFYVSMVMLLITSLSAGIMIGVISDGKVKYGFKYFPFLATGTIAIFFVCRFLIEYMGLF
jgi:flagellar protein FlaJ